MPFNEKQIHQLLQGINPKRVLKDGKNNNHLAANDVISHLIRLFGFGGFDIEVLDVEMVFETERTDKPGRWDVCYKALVRLIVKDEFGNEVCRYEDGSMATAENQKRGEAHDLSYKSSISLAIKRAAKDLGDQLGISLYSKGQITPIVKATLVGLPNPVEDVQADVDQVTSMGNDEIDTTPEPEAEPVQPAETPRERTPQETAIAELVQLCTMNKWNRTRVNELFVAQFKAKEYASLMVGEVDDINAFKALLETGAIKVPEAVTA